MNRIVVELEGNLTFCGIDKGCYEVEGKKGLLVETDSKSGLKVWCPETMIKEKHHIKIENKE